MSAQLPSGQGRVRLVHVEGLDLQSCGLHLTFQGRRNRQVSSRKNRKEREPESSGNNCL